MSQTIDWGKTTYADAFARQRQQVHLRIQGKIADQLIFTEHYPVYTIGKRMNAARHLLWDKDKCAQSNISIIQTNRGGDVTYHGPGQIIGYPIISLSRHRDLHAYLRRLEEVIIRALKTFDIQAECRTELTGVWINERKIAAIGVAVKRWVTYHGFALNVNNALEPFSGIVPCGITDCAVTSLERELGFSVDLQLVKTMITKTFWEVFKPLKSDKSDD